MLVEFLRENWDIFAWCPADMPGIPREFAEHIPREFTEHKLLILPSARPVKQTMHCFAEPKHLAIGQEIDRLLEAKFMAIPQYTYLKLKMPGPYGTITVNGLTNDRTLFPKGKKSAPASALNATNDTRAHQIHPTDPKKKALVSTSLPPA